MLSSSLKDCKNNIFTKVRKSMSAFGDTEKALGRFPKKNSGVSEEKEMSD